MAWAGTTTFIDNFARAQAFTTTPGMNGWTAVLTGTTPTAVCVTEDGGGFGLATTNTSESQLAVLYHNDVLAFDVRKIHQAWWVIKMGTVDAVTNVAVGLASAHNTTLDSVATNAWFRLIGATSTTAIVVETDDATHDQDDVATGTTLSTTYKKFLIDFTQGLADVRFFIDGARVASGTTFNMSSLGAGLNVQPYLSFGKASGTGILQVYGAQFGISYNWSYGA